MRNLLRDERTSLAGKSFNPAQLLEVEQQDPERLLENVYAYAYEFYQQGRLDEAENFFRYLCMYDFANPEYALGLGAVYQLKKQYPQAIDVYAMVHLLNRSDFRPMLYAGQCHLLLKQTEQAAQCFSAVVDGCADIALSAKASRYLAMLPQEKAGEAHVTVE